MFLLFLISVTHLCFAVNITLLPINKCLVSLQCIRHILRIENSSGFTAMVLELY